MNGNLRTISETFTKNQHYSQDKKDDDKESQGWGDESASEVSFSTLLISIAFDSNSSSTEIDWKKEPQK